MQSDSIFQESNDNSNEKEEIEDIEERTTITMDKIKIQCNCNKFFENLKGVEDSQRSCLPL